MNLTRVVQLLSAESRELPLVRNLRQRFRRVALSTVSPARSLPRVDLATAIPAASRLVLGYYARRSELFRHLAGGLQGGRPCSEMLNLSLSVERQLEVLRSTEDGLVGDGSAPSVARVLEASARLRALLWAFATFIPNEDRRRADKPLELIERALAKLRRCDLKSQALEQHFRSAADETERLGIQRLLDLTNSARDSELKRARLKLDKVGRQGILPAQRKALDEIALRAQAPSASFALLTTVAWERVLGAAERPAAHTHEKSSAGFSRRSRSSLERLHRFLELLGSSAAEGFATTLPVAEDLSHLMTQHHTQVLLAKLAKREMKEVARRDRRKLYQGLDAALVGIELSRQDLQRQIEGHRGVPSAVSFSHALGFQSV